MFLNLTCYLQVPLPKPGEEIDGLEHGNVGEVLEWMLDSSGAPVFVVELEGWYEMSTEERRIADQEVKDNPENCNPNNNIWVERNRIWKFAPWPQPYQDVPRECLDIYFKDRPEELEKYNAVVAVVEKHLAVQQAGSHKPRKSNAQKPGDGGRSQGAKLNGNAAKKCPKILYAANCAQPQRKHTMEVLAARQIHPSISIVETGVIPMDRMPCFPPGVSAVRFEYKCQDGTLTSMFGVQTTADPTPNSGSINNTHVELTLLVPRDALLLVQSADERVLTACLKNLMPLPDEPTTPTAGDSHSNPDPAIINGVMDVLVLENTTLRVPMHDLLEKDLIIFFPEDLPELAAYPVISKEFDLPGRLRIVGSVRSTPSKTVGSDPQAAPNSPELYDKLIREGWSLSSVVQPLTETSCSVPAEQDSTPLDNQFAELDLQPCWVSLVELDCARASRLLELQC